MRLGQEGMLKIDPRIQPLAAPDLPGEYRIHVGNRPGGKSWAQEMTIQRLLDAGALQVSESVNESTWTRVLVFYGKTYMFCFPAYLHKHVFDSDIYVPAYGPVAWLTCACGATRHLPYFTQEQQKMGPLNARDQSAVDAGCNCPRNMSYYCWSHDLTCPLYHAISTKIDGVWK